MEPSSSSSSSVNEGTMSASPRRQRRHHDVTCSNPHLQVLGRDGRDLPLTAAASAVSAPSSSAGNNNRRRRHWWTDVWKFSSKPPQEEHDDDLSYAALKEADNLKTEQNTTVPSSSARATTTTTTRQALLPERDTDSFRQQEESASKVASSLLKQEAPSREDEVRQDCSFFYRDFEDVVVNASDRMPLSSPQSASRYRARYQQLNQELTPKEEDRHHDLELFGDDEEQAYLSLNHTRTDLTKSSLYYKQDGRVLMKLPKDKVRLVMDPELGEPGILSSIPRKEGELEYVLTVSPDLYQKVILDVAHAHTMPCSSLLWTDDQDKLSIHVAVGLVLIVMILLLVNTIIYPGD